MDTMVATSIARVVHIIAKVGHESGLMAKLDTHGAKYVMRRIGSDGRMELIVSSRWEPGMKEGIDTREIEEFTDLIEISFWEII